MGNLHVKSNKDYQSNVFRPAEELLLEKRLQEALALKGYKLGKEHQDSFQIITYSIVKPGFLSFLSIGSIIIREQLQEVELWVYRLGNYWVDDLMDILSAFEKEVGHSIQKEVVTSF